MRYKEDCTMGKNQTSLTFDRVRGGVAIGGTVDENSRPYSW